MFPLITSLFCQKAALAIPTLALISSSHLASSDIQLHRYLNRVTCSNGTPSRVRHACDPFPTLSPPNTIIFVFLTLISMPYSLQVSFSLSIIFCNFFLLSATNTASSAYLKSVILNHRFEIYKDIYIYIYLYLH